MLQVSSLACQFHVVRACSRATEVWCRSVCLSHSGIPSVWRCWPVRPLFFYIRGRHPAARETLAALFCNKTEKCKPYRNTRSFDMRPLHILTSECS
jgi:hypothetical protein